MNHTTKVTALAAVACLALGSGACDDDTTGPGDGQASLRVSLSAGDGSAAGLEPSLLRIGETEASARIEIDAVESIILPIGDVEAQQAGGGWVRVGTVGFGVDLLDLPPGGLDLAEADIEIGSYTGLRFRLTAEPTITLSEEVRVGRTVYAAGEHGLRIPSAAQSGVKMNAAFELDESGEALTVFFDLQSAVDKVTATGSGTLMISPVLKVRNDEDEEVGEIDDDEIEGSIEFEGSVESVEVDGFLLSDGTRVVIDAETVLEGDLLSLTALAAALATDESVTAEGEGEADSGDDVVVASRVTFEVTSGDG